MWTTLKKTNDHETGVDTGFRHFIYEKRSHPGDELDACMYGSSGENT